MFTGDELLLTARASNPLTGQVARASTVTVDAYIPTKDPQGNPTDRANPDASVTLTYDPVVGLYTGSFDTSGWVTGTWALLVAVAGELFGHTYTTVDLTDG